MMLRRLVALSVLAVLGGDAAAADRPIVIAIYAPNAPFESGADRFVYINRLAKTMTEKRAVAAIGKAFARASDLEAAIRGKQVDFAVIDGVYLAERGVPYPVLATATIGRDTAQRWALFSATLNRVDELQGKRLSLAATGPRDADFIANALLDGELQVNKFFSARMTSPDIASAVAAVTLKKADAVFAPEAQATGLNRLFGVRERIPNAALCDVAGGHAPELLAKLKAAVVEYDAQGPVIDGWKAAGPEAYRVLAARMGTRTRRPVMVEPEAVRIETPGILVAPPIDASLPDPKPLYLQPSPQ